MPSSQTALRAAALFVPALAVVVVSSGGCRPPATPPFERTASTASPAALAIDTAEARRAFENNIDAIHKRDRARYLASYLHTETLARNGPGGLELGFEGWPARRDSTWPDTLVARDLRLVPISPGVVYGTYHYRVTAGGASTEGISERVFVRTADGWKIAVSTAFGLPEGASPPPLAIVGGTLVHPEAPAVPDAVVITRAGRIACAGTRAQCPLPAGIATVDATGAYVGPGLIDAHVHYSQTGWVDGRPDAIDLRAEHPYDSVVGILARHPERYHRAWLCSGVTSVFDVGGYTFTYDLARASRSALDAPRIVAAGPLLSTIDHWLNLPASKVILHMTSDSAVRAMVRAHRSLGAGAIKLWNIQLPDSLARRMKPLILAAGAEARAVGVPLIVHATELPRAKDALEAGATVLVHSVMTGEIDDAFIAAAKRNGTIVVPTLAVYEGYADVFLGRSPAARYPLDCVDPATRALLERAIPEERRTRQAAFARSGAWDRQAETMARNLRRMRDAGIPIAMGTDAGNPGTAHGPSVYREMEAMQAAGMSAREVFASATIVAARAMGLADETGSIAAGKRADLVVFDADPTADIANARRVRVVIRNGARYDRAELLPAASAP